MSVRHRRRDHRHPRQPPGARSRAGAHRRARHRDDLLRRRPRRLRPASQRGLRADRRARRSRRSTATTTTRSRATSTTAAARTSRPHDRELGQRSVEWTLAHTDQASKDFMRELPFDLRFTVGAHGRPPGPRLAAQGQRVPVRGQAGAAVRAPRRRRRPTEVLVFGHTHKPWVHEYGGVLFVNCGSVGKPKDGDPRGAFAVLRRDGDGCGRDDRARRVRRRGGRRARSATPACRASTPTSSLLPRETMPTPRAPRRRRRRRRRPRRVRARLRRLRGDRRRRRARRRARRGRRSASSSAWSSW